MMSRQIRVQGILWIDDDEYDPTGPYAPLTEEAYGLYWGQFEFDELEFIDMDTG